MTARALTVLLIDDAAASFDVLAAAGLQPTRAEQLRDAHDVDAVLLHAQTRAALAALRRRADLPPAAAERAVVVWAREGDEAIEAGLLRCGVEAIVTEAEGEAALVRAIRHAVERKRVELASRNAYATDLATGLPHEAQLLEHLVQLLALRDREPVPMGLIVLRVEGHTRLAAQLGTEAAHILRRKVAVRLRGALRASDVVASLGHDAFAVLLGRLEDKNDGERVATKLARSLQQPITVSGQPCSVRASVGLAVYPDHGKDARTLLRRAAAQAGWVATVGARKFAGMAQAGKHRAANDDPT